MLTGDAQLYAPRISASVQNRPDVVDEGGNYWPQSPLGWVSYINPAGPEVCWPQNGVLICRDALGVPVTSTTSTPSVAVDPQLGFEVQKFIAFWAYVYLPGAQDNDWVDMMRIYVVGPDKDPDYLPAQRVEWRDPESGLRYVAKRYGDEALLGNTYDKGIAAKMLQWANKLTAAAYELDTLEPTDPATGRINVQLDAQGQAIVKGGGKCVDNRACDDLRGYRGLLDFMRDTAARLGFPEPALQVYGGD
jgi:hypothetical protein